MADCIIQKHMSLTELYGRLLIRWRDIIRDDQQGTALCQHCTRKKKDHLPDERCNLEVSSRKFRDIRKDEFDKTNQAVGLIEQLMEIDE